jgi:hypothetical protein
MSHSLESDNADNKPLGYQEKSKHLPGSAALSLASNGKESATRWTRTTSLLGRRRRDGSAAR